MKKVFLDANVLYSGTCRSLFIWLHANKVVEIYWSQLAWDEVFRNFEINNDVETGAKFQTSMQKNAIDKYPEYMVRVASFTPAGLKDKDDEHILAAAVQANTDFLLTNDVVLLSENLSAKIYVKLIKPDDFLVDEAALYSPEAIKQSVEDHINNLAKTKPSRSDYLESLKRSQLGRFAAWLEGN